MIVETRNERKERVVLRSESGYMPQGYPLAALQVHINAEGVQVITGCVVGWRTGEDAQEGDEHSNAFDPVAVIMWNAEARNLWPTDAGAEAVERFTDEETFIGSPDEINALALNQEFISRVVAKAAKDTGGTRGTTSPVTVEK